MSLEAGVKLYLAEVGPIVASKLHAQAYESRMKAGRALEDMAMVLGEGLAPEVDRLLPPLLEVIAGHHFAGKAPLLGALAGVCCACPKALLAGGTDRAKGLLEVLLKEAEHSKRSYRVEAMGGLKRATLSLRGVDIFEVCKGLAERLIAAATQSISAKAADEDSDEKTKIAPEDMVEPALTCCAAALVAAPAEVRDSDYTTVFIELLTGVFTEPHTLPPARFGALAALRVVQGSLKLEQGEQGVEALLGALCGCVGAEHMPGVRLEASRLIMELVGRMPDVDPGPASRASIEVVLTAYQAEGLMTESQLRVFLSSMASS